MTDFSINPYSNKNPHDQYLEYINRQIYMNINPSSDNLTNPTFLLQFCNLQISELNHNIHNSANYSANIMKQAVGMVSSSLNDGFSALTASIYTYGSSIYNKLNEMDASVTRGFEVMEKGFAEVVKRENIIIDEVRKGFSDVTMHLCKINSTLNSIYSELQLPEVERESRHHVILGQRYLSSAISSSCSPYYKEALSEFRKAIQLSAGNYRAWYYIGYIYSNSHMYNLNTAMEALNKCQYYAIPEFRQRQIPSLTEMLDSVHYMKAQLYYNNRQPEHSSSELRQVKDQSSKLYTWKKAKYLSAESNSQSKYLAANILKNEIKKNPFLSLMVVSDFDMINSKSIMDMLRELKTEAKEKVLREQKRICDKVNIVFSDANLRKWNSETPECNLYKQEIKKIMNIAKNYYMKNTYLDFCLASYILNKQFFWEGGKNHHGFTGDVEGLAYDMEFIWNDLQQQKRNKIRKEEEQRKQEELRRHVRIMDALKHSLIIMFLVIAIIAVIIVVPYSFKWLIVIALGIFLLVKLVDYFG